MASVSLAHTCLEELVRLNEFSKGKYNFVSLAADLPESIKWLLPRIPHPALRQIVYQGSLHGMMTWRAITSPKADAVVVLEFLPAHMILFLLVLRIIPRRFVFLVHGIQQLSLNNRTYRFVLGLFRFLRFEAVQFELPDSQLPADLRLLREKCLVVPMPVLSIARMSLKPGERKPGNRIFRIGVVGVIRPGKPLAKLAGRLKQVIQEKFPEAKLVVGSPKWQADPGFSDEDVEKADTSSMENYYALLESLDVAVYIFERSDYEYRASAGITDAVSCGVHAVCPDYPVFHRQISQVARVGTTFASEADMEEALRQALAEVKAHGHDQHWKYREGRQAADFAGYFDRFVLGESLEGAGHEK